MKNSIFCFMLLVITTLKLSAGSMYVHLPNDSTICQGSTLDVIAHGNAPYYTWGTTTGASYVIVNDSTISMTSNAGTNTIIVYAMLSDSVTVVASDTVNLYEVPLPSIHVLGSDTTVAYGTELSFCLTGGSNAWDMWWISYGVGDTIATIPTHTNAPRTLMVCDTITLTQTTSFVFYVVGFAGWHSCPVSDTVTFRVTDPAPSCIDEPYVYVPNAFTPNGDGLNDVFIPVGDPACEGDYHFMIFDRWGNLIFETTDPHQGWDGTRNGRIVQIDTYVWKMSYHAPGQPDAHRIGHVSVMK